VVFGAAAGLDDHAQALHAVGVVLQVDLARVEGEAELASRLAKVVGSFAASEPSLARSRRP